MRTHKILFLAALLFCCLSCGREDLPSYKMGDYVDVHLNIAADDIQFMGTKSEFALDPKVENPIEDVWVVQYDELGNHCTDEYIPRTMATLMISDLEVKLKVCPTSTIVVFANLGAGNIAKDGYEWPGTLALLRKSRMAVDQSLDINGGADPSRLYMVGETTLQASQIGQANEGNTSINVMLSRLCCKLAVGVHQSGNEFHDIKVQILNASKGFTVFPTKESFTATYDESYTADQVASVGTSRKYFYYYLYENMDTERQTKIKVTVTGKDGQERVRIFPITSHGELIRNTFYTIDLELKGSGN